LRGRRVVVPGPPFGRPRADPPPARGPAPRTRRRPDRDRPRRGAWASLGPHLAGV